MLNSKDLSQELLSDLIQLCPDAIIGTNKAGKIVLFNQAAEQLTGFPAGDVVDKRHVTCIYGSLQTARFIKQQIYAEMFGGAGRLQGFACEILDHRRRKIPIRLSATLLRRAGQEIGCVGFFHDTTKRKQLEARLHRLSTQDCLSRLYNHRYFYTRINEEMARAWRHEIPLSLICIDLDHFKSFNDRLGHLVGDEVIRLVGKCLHSSIREIDSAFRYGGDEFMILLPQTTAADAFRCAERIQQRFQEIWPFREHCACHGIPPVTMSIGVAQTLPEDNSAEALVKRADDAMYAAKRAGGNRVL